ncbi:sensor histidine kinase [Hymenobacter lapidiphilus]|uniref:Sensor histidine kinase n=1 Tax=Hymenobacter lapidiphilus TaxID=2608003 RepID=A0A7Y7PLY8_9BACT|nr:sensor histidine kinase [Hymenobacter lapidiphilus]NVO30157.1 sensor histidine kinase [Hymenobacter lapidiphilus]
MEVLPPPAPATPSPLRPPLWRSLRARLREWLRPTEWSAHDPEATLVPRWVHILLWLWLLTIDGLKLSSILSKLPQFPPTAPEWWGLLPQLGRYLLEDLGDATLFYLTWRWLIPSTLGRGRVLQYIPKAALLLLPYLALIGWLIPQFAPSGVHVSTQKAPPSSSSQGKPGTVRIDAAKPPKSPFPDAAMRLLAASIIGSFIIGSASAMRITDDYLRGQRNRRELERQQLLTELAMLKTQINPHFLFNTLNNIYSLTSRKSDKAPEAVLRLAEIMRYLLYESSTDTVPLSRELAHLRSFLDLQRLRLPASAQEAVVLEVAGTNPDCVHPIAPLLLLPLVENAFKHGDLTARPVAVHIALHLAPDGLLRFSVLNYVAPADAERPLPRQPGGVGLANLQRRLELLYPHRHTLDVQTTPEQHRVTLVLLP